LILVLLIIRSVQFKLFFTNLCKKSLMKLILKIEEYLPRINGLSSQILL
jgi:hypothetical protein